MSLESFEHNGSNIENILNLGWAKTLNLCCVIIWSTYVQRKEIFDNFMISLADKTEKSLWLTSQLRVIIESVWHIVASRSLVQKERLGVCDYEILQINQFTETLSIHVLTKSWVLTIDYFLRNIIKLSTVMPDLYHMHEF